MEEMYLSMFSSILHDELIVAMGCTEPGCIAYCAATAREFLGEVPERITVKCSRNILKNVKGAIVPHSKGLKGVEIAATLGTIGGDSKRGLDVLANITDADLVKAKDLIACRFCQVELLETNDNLHVIVTGYTQDHTVLVELQNTHTGITQIVKDDVSVYLADIVETKAHALDELWSKSSIRQIVNYAEKVDLDERNLRNLLETQIELNSRIAMEGLSNDYGVNVGSTLINCFGNNVINRAKAYAAAGSDARMSGCNLPVVINSGSGNQGLTVTLPVIEFANELEKTHEELLRALVISNLVALRIKSGYGRLSAFCGVVSAAAGSGAAVTWMHGGTLDQIEATIVNTLANISGMVCDGAKPSCASKIASAVDNAITAHYLSMQNHVFNSGDGLVKENVEKTIDSICRMANEGMIETDKKIVEIMLES